ncbi:hypothetical protein, partial [Escherichia coli]|uniref:hypothetical protein n=1 Tax=Escherichia coli TaxID=562 RepID=UPI0032DBCBBA
CLDWVEHTMELWILTMVTFLFGTLFFSFHFYLFLLLIVYLQQISLFVTLLLDLAWDANA